MVISSWNHLNPMSVTYGRQSGKYYCHFEEKWNIDLSYLLKDTELHFDISLDCFALAISKNHLSPGLSSLDL